MTTQTEKRAALEKALGIPIPPGTEVMRDVGDIKFVHSSNDTLLPTPSASPHDPLLWSYSYKMMAMIPVLIYVYMTSYPSLSPSQFYTVLGAKFNRTPQETAYFTGAMIMTLGWGSCFFIPLAQKFGRRPSLLLATLVASASYIWQAEAKSYGSFMAARVVCGLGACLCETIGPMVVEDIFFVHQRGTWVSIYFTVLLISTNWGPFTAALFAGSSTATYKDYYWMALATGLFAFVCLVFMPETKFHRNNVNVAVETVSSDAEKDGSVSSGVAPVEAEVHRIEHLVGKGGPAPGSWSPFPKADPNSPSMLFLAFSPFRLLKFPAVWYGALCFTFGAGTTLFAGVTQAILFGPGGFGFSNDAEGSVGFVFMIVALFAGLTAGPISDLWIKRIVKRNDMIFEPEQRLPMMIPYALFMICGSIGEGVGAQAPHITSWPVMVFVCYAFQGFGLTGVCIISTTYAIECYPKYAGEVMVVATLIKNTFAFGLTFYAINWIENWGWERSLGLWSGCCTIVCVFGIPLYFYGGQIRMWTASDSLMIGE